MKYINKWINDLDVAHPQSGSSSTWFVVMLVFWGVGKTGVPRVKSLQAKERTNIKLNPHMVSSWFYHWFKFNWRLFSIQPLWRLIDFVFNFLVLGAYNKAGSWKGGARFCAIEWRLIMMDVYQGLGPIIW